MSDLKVTVLTKEFPPDIYGGAGVHVDYLTSALRKLMEVEVRCFGKQNITEEGFRVKGYQGWPKLVNDKLKSGKVFNPLSTDLAMVNDVIDADIIHAHTWYTFWAGFLAKKLYDIPLVTTIHSLEPLRPWKKEQLGNGYNISSWMEQIGIENSDRIIAVSREMKADILKHYEIRDENKIIEIYNGVDLNEYQEVNTTKALEKYNIQKEYILFVGRISRQKGIIHLLNAIDYLPEDIEIVLCAGKADTEELLQEVKDKIESHDNIIWINEMIDRREIIELYSQASVFVCPSVYEPFGIINLEAMACRTPVVASSVGGIKEVVVNNETGFLVNPGAEKEIATAVNKLLSDKDLRNKFAEAGRKRVEEYFSWDSIARQTKDMYKSLL